MDPLNQILQAAAGAGAQAAAEALGATKDTKGEDKKTQKNSDTWGPVLMVGGAILAVVALGFLIFRKR